MKTILLFTTILLTACAVTQGDIQDNRPELETIPVEITTTAGSKLEFVDGEEIQFLFSLGADAYIYMFHVDASDEVTQLLPSPHKSSHFYTKGYFLTIPDYDTGEKKGYRFIVDPPFGDETLWIFASDSSISLEKNLGIAAARELIQKSAELAFGSARFEMRTQKR